MMSSTTEHEPNSAEVQRLLEAIQKLDVADRRALLAALESNPSLNAAVQSQPASQKARKVLGEAGALVEFMTHYSPVLAQIQSLEEIKIGHYEAGIRQITQLVASTLKLDRVGVFLSNFVNGKLTNFKVIVRVRVRVRCRVRTGVTVLG